MNNRIRILIDCPDKVGLVAAVSNFLAQHQVNIVEANHHTDSIEKRFFMRHELEPFDDNLNEEEFKQGFERLAQAYSMTWRYRNASHKPRVAMLASHESHCLNDVLHRWHTGEIGCDIPCIIANHEKMRQYADWYEIPFFHVDFSDKTTAFQHIDELLETHDIDVAVLARFMQILPDYMCQKWQGKIINIHHSFLPSFAGAKPYQQAYDRGVKLIGATCHYVTSDLDEGPIIEQEVMRISHSDTVEDMVRKGKRCEINALANGLRYHLEDRIVICDHKTIVFK